MRVRLELLRLPLPCTFDQAASNRTTPDLIEPRRSDSTRSHSEALLGLFCGSSGCILWALGTLKWASSWALLGILWAPLRPPGLFWGSLVHSDGFPRFPLRNQSVDRSNIAIHISWRDHFKAAPARSEHRIATLRRPPQSHDCPSHHSRQRVQASLPPAHLNFTSRRRFAAATARH